MQMYIFLDVQCYFTPLQWDCFFGIIYPSILSPFVSPVTTRLDEYLIWGHIYFLILMSHRIFLSLFPVLWPFDNWGHKYLWYIPFPSIFYCIIIGNLSTASHLFYVITSIISSIRILLICFYFLQHFPKKSWSDH